MAYKQKPKTALENQLEDLKKNLDRKESCLEEAKLEFDTFSKEYSNKAIIIDTTKKQCSKCHLHLGHSRNNCTFKQTCNSAKLCGDVNRHSVEKKKLRELSDKVAKFRKDIDELKNEYSTKEKLIKKDRESFEKKMENYLLENYPSIYIDCESSKIKYGLVYTDILILKEKTNDRFENITFDVQECIAQYKLENGAFNCESDPVQQMSKDKDKMFTILKEQGIKFPDFAQMCPKTPEEEQEQFRIALKASMSENRVNCKTFSAT